MHFISRRHLTQTAAAVAAVVMLLVSCRSSTGETATSTPANTPRTPVSASNTPRTFASPTIPKPTSPKHAPSPIATHADRGATFGFNVKGTLDPAQQVAYAADYFAHVPAATVDGLVLRVTGGTLSQTISNADWTDAAINAWVNLQETYRLRFIYVVNGNDTPGNQRRVIQRWLDAGAQFEFLEMMNEYYLPKYENGDTTLPEVSGVVTAESYVNDILPAFWAELDTFNLPYYLVMAPSRPDRSAANARMAQWNNTVLDAIGTTYRNRNLHVTLHLYWTQDITTFDYEQISRVRQRLPEGRHIAVTEAGIIDKTLDYQAIAEIETQFLNKILAKLQTGDYLLDQVLYNTSKNNNTACLNPEFGGVTPKGRVMLAMIDTRH